MTTRTASRPFRSLGLILAGWIFIRVAVVFSGGLFGHLARTAPADIDTERSVVVNGERENHARDATAAVPATPPLHIASRLDSFSGYTGSPFRTPAAFGFFRYATYTYPAREGYGLSIAPISAMPSSTTFLPSSDGRSAPKEGRRWSGSAWLLAREDGPAALNTGGELGGSQAGVRMFYTVSKPVAVTARISRPLTGPYGGEASVGVAIRHRNIGLLLERRIALDSGGRSDFSVTAYGGFSEVGLGHGMRFDGYAQAGFVGNDAFADGAASIQRTIATIGKTRISAGGGAWGGLQPGAKRIDLGPQIVAQLPLEGSNIRISAEWRERFAGDAAPRSGPSLTIGMDF